MTELAGYYCALPCLSKSLRGPLSYQDMQIEPSDIEIAYQLRHAELFRDCMVLSAGYWKLLHGSYHLDNPEMDTSGYDSDITKAIKIARGGIAIKISTVSERLLGLCQDSPPIKKFMSDHASMNKRDTLPIYYRQMLEAVDTHTELKSDPENRVLIKTILAPLMKSNLSVCRQVGYKSGHYGHEKYFLCAEVSDDELPWDLNQKDW